MKVSGIIWVSSALAGLLVLATLALFPALRRITPGAPALIEVQNEKSVELGAGKIRYQMTRAADPNGEALLFLHGFNSNLSVWDNVFAKLDSSVTALRIDIPGFGGSDWPTPSFTLPAQAERVIAFLDTIGIRRVTLVGTSMGASLSAWLAAKHPDRVKGLVLMAPSGYPGSLKYEGAYGELLKPGVLKAVARTIAGSDLYRKFYPESVAIQALSVTDSYGAAWADALKEIHAHAWLLWSRGDYTVPFEYSKNVVDLLPSSSLLEFADDVGHDISILRPELVARLASAVHQGLERSQIQLEVDALMTKERGT